jgi:hypothetical protein
VAAGVERAALRDRRSRRRRPRVRHRGHRLTTSVSAMATQVVLIAEVLDPLDAPRRRRSCSCGCARAHATPIVAASGARGRERARGTRSIAGLPAACHVGDRVEKVPRTASAAGPARARRCVAMVIFGLIVRHIENRRAWLALDALEPTRSSARSCIERGAARPSGRSTDGASARPMATRCLSAEAAWRVVTVLVCSSLTLDAGADATSDTPGGRARKAGLS